MNNCSASRFVNIFSNKSSASISRIVAITWIISKNKSHKRLSKGLSFCEVFNLSGTTETDRAFDVLLSNGHRIWAVASDDFHVDLRLKTGWVVAFAKSRRPSDIMFALLTGNFIATTGFVISNVELLGNKISVNTGDANSTTTFYKGNMTVLATITGALAEYEIKGDEMFVRAVVQNPAGKKCWVQPYFILGSERPAI